MARSQPVMGGGMSGRKCSTCKHYEPAPIWRRGWCRNPILYAPQQNHLVFEDDLDCERGMGNYWEPADATGQIHPQIPLQPVYGDATASPRIISTHGGQPVYSVSGSSGYGDDPDDDYAPMDDDVPPPAGSGGRDLGYYPEEQRYWTDYLRIGAPILGVILILALFWFWANAFWGGDDKSAATDGTPQSTLPAITASPSATTATGATGSPIILTTPPTGVATQPPGQGTNPPPSSGTIAIGSTVIVANSGGTGVNFRSEPSTDSDIVDVLLDGTEMTVIDGPLDAEGYTWWQVEGDAGTGWLVQDYLQAKP